MTTTSLTIKVPGDLHPDSAVLVAKFAEALAKKLHRAEVKYGYSTEWKYPNWESACRKALFDHLVKGDPRDAAIYCAFMWHHGWKTARGAGA